MKLLYLIDDMGNLGGMERILSLKMNYLAERTEHQIFFVTNGQMDYPISFPLSKKITYLPIDAVIADSEHYRFLSWIPAFIKSRAVFKNNLKKVLMQVKPDIIVCTGYAFRCIDIILRLAEDVQSKVIMESHVDGPKVLLSKQFSYNDHLRHLLTIFDCHILHKVSRLSAIVTLTHADFLFWNSYNNNVLVIPNMITIKPKDVKDYSVKQIISAGRFTYQKGYDLLIDAWNLVIPHYPDWQLSIYGNENPIIYTNQLKRYKLFDTIRFLPATLDIVEKYAESSIYVMSSRFEGFPLVLGEAMSCGLPCVSFDCPNGPNEIIKNGEDGILVPNGDIKALAEAMEKLMEDVELRRNMGQNAKRNIQRFNEDAIMDKFLRLSKQIVAGERISFEYRDN